MIRFYRELVELVLKLYLNYIFFRVLFFCFILIYKENIGYIIFEVYWKLIKENIVNLFVKLIMLKRLKLFM